MMKSPLNYIGGKYRLLPQILPLFPKQINTFVDLFAGGLDVSINVDADPAGLFTIPQGRIHNLDIGLIHCFADSNASILSLFSTRKSMSSRPFIKQCFL